MMMGHKIWTQLGIEDVDYNFTFKTPSTEALLRMLPDQERTLIKVSSWPFEAQPAHQLLLLERSSNSKAFCFGGSN